MEKEVLEVVLRNHQNDSKIKRILEMKAEPALPKGENYTSTILKISAKVVLGNGRIVSKSFIAKKENTGEAAERLNDDYKLFNMEVNVYTDILKEMDYLMEELGDTEGPLWCKFIHYSPSDSLIILEDLKALGFSTVKRTEAQDLDHARLVVRSLGRYHAMAKVLELRGLVPKDTYKPFAFIHDDVYIRNLLHGGMKALVKGMRLGWGEEWAEYADKLDQVTFEECSKRIKECGKFEDDSFKCLNHGDCWNNNMMFKYSWEGKPIEMRLVDFQIPHYNSPCIDLTYYLYASLQPHVRRQNLKSLIKLYHESLTSCLDRFGYKGKKPSLAEIERNMERMSLFALSFFTACFPCVLTTRTDALDLDLVFKSNGDDGYNLKVYYEDGMKEKLGDDLKDLVKELER